MKMILSLKKKIFSMMARRHQTCILWCLKIAMESKMIIKNKIREPCEWPLVLDTLNLFIPFIAPCVAQSSVFGHALHVWKLCPVHPCEGLSSTFWGLKDTSYQQERMMLEAVLKVSYKSEQPMPTLDLIFDAQPSLSVHIWQVWSECLMRI